jgi:ABC-type glycerol-3-phosphate transport system substrate-binding protein
MPQDQQRRAFSRRALLRSATLVAAIGPAAVIAACSGASAPAPAPKPPESAKPAAPAAAAPAAQSTPVPQPASKVLAPTPTDIPLYTPVPQASGSTKLLMRVHWTQPFYNDFQSIVSDYNATQGVQDKIYIALERFVANQAGPIATFIADYQAGTQEDIYHLDDNYFPDLASRKFFQAPPKEIQEYIKGNFLEKAVESGIWDGQIMGYPTENQPHMLFVNKALLQESGIDVVAQPPKNWDDLRRMAKETTKKDASGQKTQAGWITPFSWSGYGQRVISQRVLWQFMAGSPLVDMSGPVPKWDVTSDAARQWTEFLYNVHRTDGSGSQDMGGDDVVWFQRKGAMITHDAFGLVFRVVRRGPPGLLEEQHAIPVMSPDGSKTGNTSRNYHFLVSQKTKSPDLAWKFSKWMNEGPDFRMQKFQTEVFGFPPSVKDYPMPSLFPEQIKNAFTDSLKQPHQTLFPVIKGVPRAITIMGDKHDALVLGQLSPKEYTEQLDAELQAAMKDSYDSL